MKVNKQVVKAFFMLNVRETHFESVIRDNYQLLGVPNVVKVRVLPHADTYVCRIRKIKLKSEMQVHNVLSF